MDARRGSFPEDSYGKKHIHSDSSTARALRDIAFGSFAGMVSEVFEYPFDLAKVRLQSQVLDNSARYGGPLDCLMQTWRNEGVRGLYRGLPVPMFGSMAETAGLFVAYSQLQALIRWSRPRPAPEDLSIAEHGLAAGGAGFLTSFILTPIELVKCKMQVQMLSSPFQIPSTSPHFSSAPVHNTTTLPISPQRQLSLASVRKSLPGPFAIISSVIRTSGLRGLWLGHTGTMFRESGGTAAWFASKEFFASFLLSRRSPSFDSISAFPEGSSTYYNQIHTPSQGDLALAPWESALSGALAGALCVLALYPADTVKSAIQTANDLRPPTAFVPSRQMGKHAVALPTFWGTAKVMYQAQGWRGLYAGCGMTIARAIPSSGIVFVVYDGLTQRFS